VFEDTRDERMRKVGEQITELQEDLQAADIQLKQGMLPRSLAVDLRMRGDKSRPISVFSLVRVREAKARRGRQHRLRHSITIQIKDLRWTFPFAGR
jgi:hypothetical protein